MGSLRKAVLVAACAAGLAAPHIAAGAPAKGQTYVLKGYKFGGKLDAANAAKIVAKLKHQPGDHVTEADIDADAASFARELKARHLMGRFFASSEEVRGGVWLTFALYPTVYAHSSEWSSRRLESQHFEGATGLPTAALLQATHLKSGDTLSTDKVEAARIAIMALLSKSPNKSAVSVKIRIQAKPNNEAALTWIVVQMSKPAAGSGKKGGAVTHGGRS